MGRDGGQRVAGKGQGGRPRGRSFPFFFGIQTRRAGANRYRSDRISSMIASIFPSDMPSAVSPLAPGVIAPWLE